MSNWNTDAQFANELSKDHLHKNSAINNFLGRRNLDKFILVASKGMGKTLLMRHKREQLQKSPEGVLLIPSGEQSDYVSLPSLPSKSIIKSLEDSTFWEDLWKASIIASMVLNNSNDLNVEEIDARVDVLKRSNLPEEIENLLVENTVSGQQKNIRPSKILDILLRDGKNQFELFRKYGLNNLVEIYHNAIRSACAVFIDSLDQELNKRFPGNLEVWCAGQIGLLSV